MTGEARRRGRHGESQPGATDVERELGRLVPVDAPPGLRTRILGEAAASRRSVLLPPWMRVAAAAASTLIVAALVAGPVIDRSEAARMAAVLDGRPAAPSAGEDARVLAEALGGAGVAGEAARLGRLETLAGAAARRDRERQAIEAREWLKGWLEDETSQDLE
jgi:hypothetical protein